MPIVTLTQDEDLQRQGRAFTALHSVGVLAAAATSDIVIVPSRNTTIHTVDITTDSETILWQAFGGITHTPGTGTLQNIIPRNFRAATEPPATVELDPTISDTGISFFGAPIELIGLQGAGARDLLEADLVTDTFALAVGLAYLIRLTNNTAGDLKYVFSMGIYAD